MRKKLSRQQRENQALEAIIAATLRGWGQKEWEECFRRMDEKAQSAMITKKSRDINSRDLNEPYH